MLKTEELGALMEDLREMNGRLWDIEDALRVCEHDKGFGPRFVELSRSDYHHSDRRAELKRQIAGRTLHGTEGTPRLCLRLPIGRGAVPARAGRLQSPPAV